MQMNNRYWLVEINNKWKVFSCSLSSLPSFVLYKAGVIIEIAGTKASIFKNRYGPRNINQVRI